VKMKREVNEMRKSLLFERFETEYDTFLLNYQLKDHHFVLHVFFLISKSSLSKWLVLFN